MSDEDSSRKLPRPAILSPMERIFLGAGAVLGFLGVAAGAFGTHGLRDRLSPEMLTIFETAVRYQLVHALALLAVAWLAGRSPSLVVNLAGWFFVAGVVVFSGTLYVLAMSGVRWWGGSNSAGRPGPAGRMGLSDLDGLDPPLAPFGRVPGQVVRASSYGTSEPAVRARSQNKNRESSTD